LQILEKGEQGGALARLADDLPCFAQRVHWRRPSRKPSALEDMLRDIRPDELSPREALELLYRLRSLLPD
jgi:DNA mismatch repair protein MutS